MRRRVVGLQLDGALEMGAGFRGLLQYREEEANLVFELCGIGREFRSVLVGLEGPYGISALFPVYSLFSKLLEGFSASRTDCQQDEKDPDRHVRIFSLYWALCEPRWSYSRLRFT